MAQGSYQIIAGTTSPVRFQLLEAGNPINLTNCVVTLLLSDRTGTVVTAPGTVTITDAINGKVQLAPINGTVFAAALSPYSARWKILDGNGLISFCPNGSRDSWNIIDA